VRKVIFRTLSYSAGLASPGSTVVGQESAELRSCGGEREREGEVGLKTTQLSAEFRYSGREGAVAALLPWRLSPSIHPRATCVPTSTPTILHPPPKNRVGSGTKHCNPTLPPERVSEPWPVSPYISISALNLAVSCTSPAALEPHVPRPSGSQPSPNADVLFLSLCPASSTCSTS
jgi:hypothetical protein